MHALRSLRHAHRKAGGFTLVELMIAVAVVAILAALALPSFMDSIRKGRRAEAVAALAQVQQAQERWRANNAAYTTALAASAPDGLGLSPATPGGLYALSVDAADAIGYTVSATANTGTSQASDSNCSTMRVRLANGNVQYGGCTGCDMPVGVLTDPHRCWSR